MRIAGNIVAVILLLLGGLWIGQGSNLIGGSVIFGLGVALSVYRDRLLTLPERIKERQGVFRVLTWR